MAEGNVPATLQARGVDRLFELLDSQREGLLSHQPPARGEVARLRLILPADYLGIEREVIVAVPAQFPGVDLVFQVTPSPDLQWPHLLGETACLFGFGQWPASREPEALVDECVQRFARVVDLAMPHTPDAERQAEFQSELATYWGRSLTPDDRSAQLLARPLTSTALWAFVDPGRQRTLTPTLLCADRAQLARSVEARTGRREKMRDPAAAGFYAKLVRWPDPRPPSSVTAIGDIAALLVPADGESLRNWAHASAGMPVRWLVVELPDTTPVRVMGLVLRANDTQRHHTPAYGRRAARHFPSPTRNTSVSLGLCSVDVVAEDEIFSRNPEPGMARLRGAKVLMVGAGSLGGPVARHLLRAGVGQLVIVDPKRMRVSNLGRHELGAPTVGQWKAHALATILNQDFVTAKVTAVVNPIQKAMLDVHLFDGVDAVVVTTGELASEAPLWEYKQRTSASWILLQGWAEPTGAVGHVLVAPSGAFDARPLFEPEGHFRFAYTSWPNHGFVPLPACGTGFVPAGPLAMGNNATLVANAVVRALVEPPPAPTWHTTTSEPDRIAAMGGIYVGPEAPACSTQWTQIRPWPELW